MNSTVMWKRRKDKRIVEFDEDARRDYLLGFQKRKNKRRVAAKLENEEKLKAEKKKIITEHKEWTDKQLKKHEDMMPDFEEVVEEQIESDYVVTITSLDLSNSNLLTGGDAEAETAIDTSKPPPVKKKLALKKGKKKPKGKPNMLVKQKRQMKGLPAKGKLKVMKKFKKV